MASHGHGKRDSGSESDGGGETKRASEPVKLSDFLAAQSDSD